MKFARGLAFPDADQFMIDELKYDASYQASHLEAALLLVNRRGGAIDGGAHVGTWTLKLAETFLRVIAVEPSEDTYKALVHNVSGHLNVETCNFALGAELGYGSMSLDDANAARANTGARFVGKGRSVEIRTVDSLGCLDLDFLKLDVEGSEPAALLGAKETIARCRPVILFEDKKLWTRHYGLPKDAVKTILAGYGYRHLARVGCDEIWGPK